MPVFFLHVREGAELIRDPDGGEFADLAAARGEAVRAARSLLGAAVLAGRLPLDHAIVVADADGGELLAITFAQSVGTDPPGRR